MSETIGLALKNYLNPKQVNSKLVFLERIIVQKKYTHFFMLINLKVFQFTVFINCAERRGGGDLHEKKEEKFKRIR